MMGRANARNTHTYTDTRSNASLCLDVDFSFKLISFIDQTATQTIAKGMISKVFFPVFMSVNISAPPGFISTPPGAGHPNIWLCLQMFRASPLVLTAVL